ncbi:MAG: hypothetical protein ACRDRR_22000 [Pseudonocardiaceae bacterium]
MPKHVLYLLNISNPDRLAAKPPCRPPNDAPWWVKHYTSTTPRRRPWFLGLLLLLSSTVRRIHTVHRAQVPIAPAAPAPNARCSWDAA